MKPYRDVFGNPLSKQDVAAATRLIVSYGKTSQALLVNNFKWGYGKTSRIMQVIREAGIVGPIGSKPSTLILKNEDEAVNAALRQLKKGRK